MRFGFDSDIALQFYRKERSHGNDLSQFVVFVPSF